MRKGKQLKFIVNSMDNFEFGSKQLLKNFSLTLNIRFKIFFVVISRDNYCLS